MLLNLAVGAQGLIASRHTTGKKLHWRVESAVQKTGDAIRILGFPSFGPGSSLQVRDAKIVAAQAKSGVRQLIVDGKINQGNSGGPIVDPIDRVVGVAHKGGPAEAIDIAIAVTELSKME